MYTQRISHKRLWAWLAVAMSAPLAHFSGGSWLALGVVGAICIGTAALMPEKTGGGKLLFALELVWIVILLGQLTRVSAEYWPGEKSEYVVPAVIIALGAYSCQNRASRVGAALFWVLALLYAPVMLAGAKDVQLRWLMPEDMQLSGWMIPVLLLPCLARWLPVENAGGTKWHAGIVLFGVALWAATNGVLSPYMAARAQTPFRDLSRSLTLGSFSRFESLVSAAVTFGWFALAAYLIRCGSIFARELGVSDKIAHWIVGIAGVAACWWGTELSGELAGVISVFAWILCPPAFENFSRKKEKKALDKG